jgi:hypothetical protein
VRDSRGYRGTCTTDHDAKPLLAPWHNAWATDPSSLEPPFTRCLRCSNRLPQCLCAARDTLVSQCLQQQRPRVKNHSSTPRARLDLAKYRAVTGSRTAPSPPNHAADFPRLAAMHLYVLHRSAHYRHSSVIPRSTSSNDSQIWSILGPVIVTIITLVLVALLILWLKSRLAARSLRRSAQGPHAHFKLGSVRRTNRNNNHNNNNSNASSSPGVQKRPAKSAFVGRPPFPDASHFAMYDFGVITRPGPSYARQWSRPGYDGEAQTGFAPKWPAQESDEGVRKPPTKNPFEDGNGPL